MSAVAIRSLCLVSCLTPTMLHVTECNGHTSCAHSTKPLITLRIQKSSTDGATRKRIAIRLAMLAISYARVSASGCLSRLKNRAGRGQQTTHSQGIE